MLHFTMNMPLYLMMFSGSILLLIVLFLRCLLKKKLPGYVFPILWGLVMIRFLVPFSLSSPLSLKAFSYPSLLQIPVTEATASARTLAYDIVTADVPADVSVASKETTADSSASDEAMMTAFDTDSYRITQRSESPLTSGMTISDLPIESVAEEVIITESPFSVSYQIADSAPLLFESRFTRSLRFAVYLLGIVVTAGILLLQKYRYARRLQNSLLIEHNETVNAVLRELQMSHILVFSNDEIASPLVCGLLTPRIYLPTRMDFQNAQMLQHILAHETMHIRHKDNWIKTIMLILLCVNWFNPLVWIMARCLASDLETACDEAVLRSCQDEDDRKGYAFSLLSMAVTANRSTLLYSAFSKTEVEKRIQRILQYKKTSALMLLAVGLLLSGSTVAFATGIQAPFDSYLSSTCYYGDLDGNSRWACKVYLTRDIALGDDPGRRADDAIMAVLKADTTGDPDVIKEQVKEALSEEFHVEKGAFAPECTLCLNDETEEQEYTAWEITRNENGLFCYQGKPIHSLSDRMNGTYQTNGDGVLDIEVLRDRLGYITSVMAYEDGMIVRIDSAPKKMEP